MSPTRREFFVWIAGLLTWAKLPLTRTAPAVNEPIYSAAQCMADELLRHSMIKTATVSVRPGHVPPAIGSEFAIKDGDGALVFSGYVTKIHGRFDSGYTVTASDDPELALSFGHARAFSSNP